MYSKYFSDTVKEVIGLSKELAEDLGDDMISTIHFFLANCQLKYQNPMEFVFPDENALEAFYASRKKDTAGKTSQKKIELTREAEQAIRQSYFLMKRIKAEQVQPIHLMLAIAKMQDSAFLLIVPDKRRVYKRLVAFYMEKEYLQFTDKKWMERLKRIIKRLTKRKR